jgi:RNA polymerase sigma-70 factor (ECF subfamily)
MGNPEDIQDMLSFQRGDEQGFRRLFLRYSGPVSHYLFRFTGNHAQAEELMQETFLRVCRAACTYEPRTTFRTWLYQIATNVGRNEVRRREYSVRKEPLGDLASECWDPCGGGRNNPDGGCPEGMAEARETEQIIQGALGRMPEKQRAALLLSRHHGLSYREISHVMGLREGAVKSLIHRATETLHKHLTPYLRAFPAREGEGHDAM